MSSNSHPFAFVLMPFAPEFDDIYHLGIKPACEAVKVHCERVDEQIFTESITERIYTQIGQSDIVIADLTGRNPNVFYETGIAHAMGKPVVLVVQDLANIPFDLKLYPYIVYGRSMAVLRAELAKRLLAIVHAIKPRNARPPKAVPKSRRSSTAKAKKARGDAARAPVPGVRDKVFVSYSHRDIKWLKRLQIHLRPLERDNLVRRWDDTMLDAGDEWRARIRQAVADAKVAILLVSADFIASEFVHTNELPPLLAAAETEGAHILPIIVSPSRFEQIKNLSRFQAFNPPSKPLTNMSRTQQEQLFVNVASRVAEILAPEAG